MKLKMKRTSYGSPDGVLVEEYKKGETYEVRQSLATIFLQEGWAVKVAKVPRSTKDEGGTPENKTVKLNKKSKRRRSTHGA